MRVVKIIPPLLTLIIILFLFLSTSLLLFDPPIWPDEAIIADISRNLYTEHRLGTNLWQGFVDGVENHVYWWPPLFLYTNAILFAATGFSLTNQRLLTVFFSVIFLITYYLLLVQLLSSKKLQLKQFLPGLTMMLLITDKTFLKASRWGRPEILVLALVFPALLFYAKTLVRKKVKNINLLLFFSGLFLGMATITHLIAISFAFPVISSMILKKRTGIYRFLGFYLFIIGFILPVSAWLLSIFPNYQILKNQLFLVSEYRLVSDSWINKVWNFSPIPEKISYLTYFFISLCFIIFAFIRRQPQNLFLAFSLLSVWIFVIIGKIETYPVFFIPLVFIAFAILFEKARSTFFKSLLSLTLFAVLVSNLYLYFESYKANLRTDESYRLMRDKILETIPAGKTVYLSSIPDAYFFFELGRNKLYEFPAVKTSIQNYKKVLDESDYIIFNAFLDHPSVANYLNTYVSRNLATVKQINLPNGTTILVIKLIDLKDRKD